MIEQRQCEDSFSRKTLKTEGDTLEGANMNNRLL